MQQRNRKPTSNTSQLFWDLIIPTLNRWCSVKLLSQRAAAKDLITGVVSVASRNLLIKESCKKMRGYIMMLVGAVFASNLLTFAPEARGQVVNNGDRFRSGGGYIGGGGRSDKRGPRLRYRSASQSAYGQSNPRCHF